MLRKTLLVVFGLVWAHLLLAQSGTLKGTVTDAKTGETIPMANVSVEHNGNVVTGAMTDFDGNYTIKPISTGKYNIKASYMGYNSIVQNGVVISTGKITFLNFKLKSSVQELDEVEVITYKIPLIEKDNTETGQTVQDVDKISGRQVSNVVTTVAGVYSEDGEIGSIRGQRSEGNVIFIDGIKVRGTNSLPKSAIEEVSVKTGGLSARYGDVTGGIIAVTTKGPSRYFGGSFEAATSQYLDNYNYNLGSISLTGPIYMVTDKRDTTLKRSLAGFLFSSEFSYYKDNTPFVDGIWKVKDDVKQDIINDPLRPSGLETGGSFPNAAFLYGDSFEKIDAKINAGRYRMNVAGKIDISPSRNTNITLGGTFDYYDKNLSSWANEWRNSLFNWDNYGHETYITWRTYARFTQKFTSQSIEEEEEKASIIKNAYYTIQVDFSKIDRIRQNDKHRDEFFKYGYVGKFNTYKIKSYTPYPQLDTIAGLTGYLHNGFRDTLYDFYDYWANGGPAYAAANDNWLLDNNNVVNEELATWNQRYYELYNDIYGNYMNDVNVQNGLGLLNGRVPGNIYGIWTSPGVQYNTYRVEDNMQFRISASGSADVKNHAIALGLEFEQRNDRYFGLAPRGLWTIARLWTNNHILELDLDNPHPVSDANDVFQDTIWYDRLYNSSIQALFDIELRKHLGLDVDGTDWIDVDALDPSDMSIDYFSAEELLNNGNSYVAYFGYDHHGNRLTQKPSFEDFFTDTYTDDAGNTRYSREVAPFEPIYTGVFLEDKFSFKDIVFNVGVRVDRFDLNQKVLKDQYSLYETYSVADAKPGGAAQSPFTEDDFPSSIGDDYVVYVNDINNPTDIIGFRDESTWYNASGTEVDDPTLLYTATGIAPYLVDADAEFGPEAFEDYEPQITVMPRISFSFPISDEAAFWANYSVLSKRPTYGSRLDLIDYLYINQLSNQILNNPALKTEKTISYELGFKQRLSNTSALTLSAFYSEIRDLQQVVSIIGAYPVNYYTHGNIDFGTVKGLTINYDMRRTGNITLNFSYTLQFANGTGSNYQSGVNLVSSGQPNLRTTIPLDYDQRHALVGRLDYRYGGKANGTPYNGPSIKGVNLFTNTGANFTVQSGSGSPYSQQMNVVPTMLGGGSSFLEGSLNGSRKPWRTTINMRIDKEILIKWGGNEEKQKESKTANMILYLDVSNILNAKNVINVYRATGNPDDDGYLTAPEYQDGIASQYDEASFRNYYLMGVNSPTHYSRPRTVQLGVILSF